MVGRKNYKYPHRSRVNSGKREKINRRENNEEQNIKVFQMSEVHLHMSCHCRVLPIMRMNKDIGTVEIPVASVCPICHDGNPTELVVGDKVWDTDGKCSHPGCDCDSVSMVMPWQEFIGILEGNNL